MAGSIAAWLAGSTAGFCAGTFFLKRFGDGQGWMDITLALSCFLLANLAYARVLAHGMAQGVVLSSMASLVVTCVIGALVFGERFAERQVAGLAFAMAAAWMFAAPKIEGL